MVDLYVMGSPNVVKINICRRETGFPYTMHPVDVVGEEQRPWGEVYEVRAETREFDKAGKKGQRPALWPRLLRELTLDYPGDQRTTAALRLRTCIGPCD